MSGSAIALLTYIWHYVAARVVYDDLVRPLIHGDVSSAILLTIVGGAGFAIGRRSRSDAGRRSRSAG